MTVVKKNVNLLFFLWAHGPETVKKSNEADDRKKAKPV